MIYPVPESLFEDLHGIPPSDVGKLVDFAKSEARIQFALGGRATRYEKLDFLDPIFELEPPRFSILPETYIVDEKSYKKYRIEFDTLANVGYKRYFHRKCNKVKQEVNYDANEKEEYQTNLRAYSLAKCLGYDDLTDLIEIMLLEDYESADKLLGIAEHFIFREVLSPFKRIHTYCGHFLASLQEAITKNSYVQGEYETTKEIPFEIGRFLIKNKKLTNASGDFEACKELCSHYRQSDLHKLLINIQNGIKDRNIGALTSTRKELNTELDNLWNDTDSIRKRMNLLETTIPVSLGIVGELAGHAVNSDEHYGILSYLGVKVIDRILGSRKERISERLAKWRKTDYLIGIFNFQEKLPRTLKEH